MVESSPKSKQYTKIVPKLKQEKVLKQKIQQVIVLNNQQHAHCKIFLLQKRHEGRTSCVIDTCCFLSGAKDAR